MDAWTKDHLIGQKRSVAPTSTIEHIANAELRKCEYSIEMMRSGSYIKVFSNGKVLSSVPISLSHFPSLSLSLFTSHKLKFYNNPPASQPTIQPTNHYNKLFILCFRSSSHRQVMRCSAQLWLQVVSIATHSTLGQHKCAPWYGRRQKQSHSHVSRGGILVQTFCIAFSSSYQINFLVLVPCPWSIHQL